MFTSRLGFSLGLVSLSLLSSLAFAQSNGLTRTQMVAAGSIVPVTDSLAWKITQPTWLAHHEQAYSDFVVAIATAFENKECKDIDSCLRSPRNIYRSTADSRFRFYPVDCGRLPYLLRSYFAWKNGLPFSYTAQVVPRNPNDPSLSSGLQYTSQGNIVAARSQVVQTVRGAVDFADFQERLMRAVFTATLRTAHRQTPQEAINDFYTVAIRRDQIRPGTVIYYPEGHAAVVFKVNADGSIKTFEAHPGNFLSVKTYADGYRGIYSNQLWGGGLKNFRPLSLVGASRNSSGHFIGGNVAVALDSQVSGVDYFQAEAHRYFATPRDFIWYMSGNLQTQPTLIVIEDAFEGALNKLCTFVKDRARFVEQAISQGSDEAVHAPSLPRNILLGDGNDPRWEAATFGRDINVRRSYREVLTELQFLVSKYQAQDRNVTTRGGNLATNLEVIYNRIATNCRVSYVSRDRSVQTLNLEQVRLRLMALSSDPYLCADYRWGDSARGQALCSEDTRWYNAQQFLRNQTSREDLTAIDARGDLANLERMNARLNRPVQFDTDFLRYIRSLYSNPLF